MQQTGLPGPEEQIKRPNLAVSTLTKTSWSESKWKRSNGNPEIKCSLEFWAIFNVFFLYHTSFSMNSQYVTLLMCDCMLETDVATGLKFGCI